MWRFRGGCGLKNAPKRPSDLEKIHHCALGVPGFAASLAVHKLGWTYSELLPESIRKMRRI